MASGDAQRTWFPEIVKILRTEWKPSLSWEEFIDLRDILDSTLQSIRSERNILPPMFRCPECQEQTRSEPPKISVRAVILALGRFNIAKENKVKELDKGWKKYRKENGLDLYGKKNNEQK